MSHLENVELPVISLPATPTPHRLPRWLKRPLPSGGEFTFTDRLINDLGLETVCKEAHCPNRTECWSRKTATFMILGRVCTRPCGFCAVERGHPEPLAEDEPERLAEAAERLGLRHVVITSVTRDDLPEGGADHFRRCILAVRRRMNASIEVLTPDFNGDTAAIDIVLAGAPDVFNHNIETVARLQQRVRRKAAYETSLSLLAYVKRRRPDAVTKSGIMLGLGETTDEILEAFADLRNAGVDLLTVGQYLQPSPKHLPVERFVPPEEFASLGRLAETMGFAHVASAPFVRSSYHADEAWLLARGETNSPQSSILESSEPLRTKP
ncbi:MAG: lipoyl synthase [Planctomycetota bacterium]